MKCLYIKFNVIKSLLTPRIYREVSYKVNVDKIEEIRLTVGKIIRVTESGKRYDFSIATKEDVDYTVSVLVKGSLYAVNDYIKQGFITYDGGIRAGLCGESVYDSGKIQTIKNINGLVLRIPHNHYGIAENLIEKIVRRDGTIKNTIIFAPPYSGKTTLLREFARQFSHSGKNVVIIDEKNEISATNKGISFLDIGESMALVGIKRQDGFESAIRNLSPDILITDEIFGESDIKSVKRCIQSGVALITSMHAGITGFEEIAPLFDYCIKLSRNPVGKILYSEDIV